MCSCTIKFSAGKDSLVCSLGGSGLRFYREIDRDRRAEETNVVLFFGVNRDEHLDEPYCCKCNAMNKSGSGHVPMCKKCGAVLNVDVHGATKAHRMPRTKDVAHTSAEPENRARIGHDRQQGKGLIRESPAFKGVEDYKPSMSLCSIS